MIPRIAPFFMKSFVFFWIIYDLFQSVVLPTLKPWCEWLRTTFSFVIHSLSSFLEADRCRSIEIVEIKTYFEIIMTIHPQFRISRRGRQTWFVVVCIPFWATCDILAPRQICRGREESDRLLFMCILQFQISLSVWLLVILY